MMAGMKVMHLERTSWAGCASSSAAALVGSCCCYWESAVAVVWVGYLAEIDDADR